MSQTLSFKEKIPIVQSPSFIAQNAILIGNVSLGKNSGVWFNSVIRGDVSYISIGNNTNIQDNTVIHVTRPNHLANKTGEDGGPVKIGNNVTIGHSCIIHATTIGNNCFVGMGSILLDGSIMEDNSMLGAGSLLSGNKVVKKGELWMGRPAKFARLLSKEEVDYFQVSADNYWALAQDYF